MYFLRRALFTIPTRLMCVRRKLADQVLEPIRKRIILVEDKLNTHKSFCSPQILLKFSEQKSASSVNF
jgi:hypothetical protein